MNISPNKDNASSSGGTSAAVSIVNMLAVSGFVIYMFLVS